MLRLLESGGRAFECNGAKVAAVITSAGVLHAKFQGVLTARIAETLRAAIAGRLGTDVLAVMANYTDAALELTPEEQRAMMAGDGKYQLPELPAVVVSVGRIAEQLRDHATHAAMSRGRRRVVVSSAHEAAAWADARATEARVNRQIGALVFR